jgi:hypothetical protein
VAGAVLVLATAGAWYLGRLVTDAARVTLVVSDARRGAVLLRQPVLPGARIRLAYLHSVSRTRVEGVFEVARDGLVVRETSFGTPGPGLPEPGPGDRWEVREGRIRQYDLGQRLPDLSFFVHPYTEHRLEVAGRTLDLSGRLPAGSLVRVAVEPARGR